MTLLVTKTLNKISLCDNPIKFIINSDNYISSPGKKERIYLQFELTGPLENDHFTLAWGDNSLTFTFKTTPDESGLQLPIYISGNIFVWLETVAAALRSNYLLYSDFKVSYSGVGYNIDITAREKGEAYDITFSESATSLQIFDFQDGEDDTYRDFYRLILQVYLAAALNYNDILLGSDELPVDENGNAEFDIAGFIKPEFEYDFHFPESGALFAIQRVNTIKNIRLRYAETYDNTVKELFSSGPHFIKDGGINKRDLEFYDSEDSNYFDYSANQKHFLTWGKIISVNQPEKLFFLFRSHEGITKLKCKATYELGVKVVKTIKEFTVAVCDVYEFIISPHFFIDDLSFIKYEIWLEDVNGVLISETRTYYLDHKTYLNERFFFFKNSFGVTETLRCTGIQSKNIEINRTAGNLINDITGNNAREIKNFDNIEKQKLKTNTGWTSLLSKNPKDFKNYLRDFLLSTDISEKKGDILFPVNIISKKAFIHKDKEYLYDLLFEYYYSHEDEKFSDEISEGTKFLRSSHPKFITNKSGQRIRVL
jgi:hypothetical protein